MPENKRFSQSQDTKTNFAQAQPKKALHARPVRERKPAYSTFEQLNGEHPWQLEVPEGCVLYPVTHVEKAEVAFFNFDLAKEMGLIPPSHPHKLNEDLVKKLKSTFCIRILNEYDQKNLNAKGLERRKAAGHKLHMATRYLQLQHSNKQGKTSGDGRSIWNGVVKNGQKVWDVSSRGTGVTCFAPGAVAAQKHLKTGDESFGYSCGLADVDELLSSAIMSEVFHRQGLGTERVLAVFDLGKGRGIGVRAGENLFRPAHFFLYLKQHRYDLLSQAFEFFVRRQVNNGSWPKSYLDPQNRHLVLRQMSENFAKFAARLESDYIFVWMDWDGDNVLANTGIIDYGSVRRFGSRHDQYRYDDVERFSTTLNEQVNKTREIVQMFCQMIDFLKTKKKKSLKSFARHSALKHFDKVYRQTLQHHTLRHWGLGFLTHTDVITRTPEFKKFRRLYSAAESLKANSRKAKLPDGFTVQPLYSPRKLREAITMFFLQNETYGMINFKKLHAYARISDVRGQAGQFTPERERLLRELVRSSFAFFNSLQLPVEQRINWLEQTQAENQTDILTGNGLELAIREVLELRAARPAAHIQSLLELFVDHFAPSSKKSSGPRFSVQDRLFADLTDVLDITREYIEDI